MQKPIEYRLDMTEEERDRFVATEIKAGRCPFGRLKEGENIAMCPLGFPGCGCGDELMLNPFLQEEENSLNERKKKRRSSKRL